ncbi:flagellin [Yersinia enterocolitica]|uniref:flagellin n=1 Tax=Yersinia enterocolitica TaxID=630 RepID=UPI001CA5E892|nr:flagellin [Yersinia enterocolitica]MBW5833577.1 flagellin [Yersinia enterocolitica]
MAISMNTNTTAMSSALVMDKSHQKLSSSHQNMGKGTKQLTAADAQIIGKMARETSGLKVGQSNIKKATSMLGIAQGAFQSVNGLLTQMKEKSFAATNVANGASERKAYQEEFSSLSKQLERVFSNTTFNGEKLLAKGGKLDGALVFQTGTQNSSPMNADFTDHLAKLMKGITAQGTQTSRAGVDHAAVPGKSPEVKAADSIEKRYFDALTKYVKANDTAGALERAVDIEVKTKERVDIMAKNKGAALEDADVTADLASVYKDNSDADNKSDMTKLALHTANGMKATVNEVVIEIQAAVTAGATATTLEHIASNDSIEAIKELAATNRAAADKAKIELDAVMDHDNFVRAGVLNLDITDNVKSQEAAVALEKLALSFDEINSNVQALMDSMQAQSEMQSTVINKTEEAIGATRDTDYMEETSNIAAAKLRNVTAMAAVKQSYEITSTIINTLVNVNN